MFATALGAQSSSTSTSTSSDGQTILTGVSENATPSGPYLSYASTETAPTTTTPSAITTSIIVSTVSSGSLTRTTTLGSTTILGYGTGVMGSNSSSTTKSTSSQLLLQGSGKSSSTLNSTISSTQNTTTTSAPQATNTTPCNNFPEFCERSYGNITEVAAHNSPFIRTDNAAANQALDVTTQLNDGIRLLQAQIQFINGTPSTGEPHFCHTSCDVLDAGPITEYLGKVYDWVSTHPYDVVTILLGNGRLANNTYTSSTTYAPYIEQTGLVQYAYIPPKIPMALDDWPTLASMILRGKRVVIFMDYQANQTAIPWILDEFSQMWETPYDPTDRSFPCDVQRPPNQTPEQTTAKFYMANHNLNYEINILGNSILVPNIPLLNITNNVTGYGSLGVAAAECNSMHGNPPKFLNVDYYNVGSGSVFKVAAQYNNVTYDRSCCGASTSGAKVLELAEHSAMLTAFAVVAASWFIL